jgi:microcystin synthetase protein McyG
MACANAGLFPRPSFSLREFEQVSFATALQECFEARPYRIRHPQVEDLPALIELDSACWPEPLRTPAEKLRQRLSTFPSGHCALEMGGRIVGAIYSHRIAGTAELSSRTGRDVFALHRDDGPVVQLLSVNVLPEMQNLGLGDQLFEFMLHYCSTRQGVEQVMAVSLCREYGAHQSMPLEEYLNLRDERGKLVEPILRFHEAHGGTIAGLLPGYRPQDLDNRGNGVIVLYDLWNRRQVTPSGADAAGAAKGEVRQESVAAMIDGCLRRVMGPDQTLDPTRPLMEMGFDSLRLMELRTLLAERFGCEIEAGFFFRYSSPKKIAEYFEQGVPADEIPAREEHRGRSGASPLFSEAMAGEQTAPDPGAGRSPSPVTEQEVAVIGMACRFTGGVMSPDDFWRLLSGGVDAISEVPASRWDLNRYYDADPEAPGRMVSRFGGFISDIERFDAPFFHISGREATAMDPQQRLLLEVTWEALENASLDPLSLAGTSAGVFVGIASHDYEILRLKSSTSEDLDTYFATGNSPSMAAGRLAYFFGSQGPALSIDTACSSSLVAVHQACQSLRRKESSLALAAGVNLLLSPELSITFSRAGMLSPAGRCKTFDAAADGYVRSEGCGVVVLKLLSQALSDGDPVLAVLKGSAINQDGASNGLTAPNGLAQEEVLRQALADAGVSPREVSYVEAHGTGTALGDPVEVSSLASVYGQGRGSDNPLILGSVKTNIGHAEAAAGIAGLIKVILCLRHHIIPGHLHFKKLNPLIALDAIPARVAAESMSWGSGGPGARLLAGVSSFGFSGTNAHVVVAEAPGIGEKRSAGPERPLHLLTISAPSEEGLHRLTARYEGFFAAAPESSLADSAFTANTGRAHFSQRLSIVARSGAEIVEKLRLSAAEAKAAGVRQGVGITPPKIAFLFTGQGSQFAGMGRELYDTQPTFRQALDRCAAILHGLLDRPLLDIIYPHQPGPNAEVNQTAYTQPALFALEYALCELWKSWGVEPAAVMGHSVGEYVAACTAGVFTLEEGLRLIAARGRLMQSLPGNGAMAAIFAEEALVLDALRPFPKTISVAAINGPQLTVISGLDEDVATVSDAFTAKGVTVMRLTVSHAFHSPLMEPILAPFAEVAGEVRYGSPQLDLISNLTGEAAGGEIATPAYWVNHIRAAVRFAAGMETLYRQGYRVFVEIGPHPVLVGMGRKFLPEGECTWLPSLYRGQPDWEQLLPSVAELYVQGAKIDWQGFDRDYGRRKVALPTYPFEGGRYWLTPGQAVSARVEAKGIGRVSGSCPVEKDGEIQDLLYRVEWRRQPGLRSGEANGFPHPREIGEALMPRVRERIHAMPDLLQGLERLSVAYVCDALAELGWDFVKGSPIELGELARRLGVADKHLPLLARLLCMLAEEGIVRRGTEQGRESWESAGHPEIDPAIAQWRQLSARYPKAETELTLLSRCGAGLAGVLRGESDPLELLFPEADLTTAARLYEDSLSFGPMNELMGEALATILNAQGGGKVTRILELGAGTGGTTAHILPGLKGREVEYVFTDLSTHFLAKAKERFKAYPFMRYQLLDIEREPAAQGLPLHAFDIVLAANVLHATEDLRRTLSHVRQLLAPGGMLVLLEGIERRRWLDMIFGLLDGWWKFRDHELRPAHPLLGGPAWESLLLESGFTEPELIAPGQPGVLFDQAVIVCRSAGQNLEVAAPISAPQSGHWLLFADSSGVANRLAQLLRQQGDAVTLAFSGARFSQRSAGEFTFNGAKKDEYPRLLHEAATGKPAVQGVVDLRGLDSGALAAGPDNDPGGRSLPLCLGFLHLVQGLIGLEGAPPSLWLVTAKAVPAIGTERLGLAQAPLWGLAQVVGAEHPEFNCTRIDIADAPEAADRLMAELRGGARENQVALRMDGRYVARLVPWPKASLAEQAGAGVSPDHTYLITGGLGGIGLRIARQLAEAGARHLLLVSRRGKPAASDPAAQVIRELEQAGVELTLAAADVSSPEDLARVWANLQQSPWPLKGLVHAAGVFEDRLLADHGEECFARVFAAKVNGAWNLHQLTKELALDLFVLCSSATSVVCSSGLGNYVAANAFLDALAHYRRSIGLAGLSIGWGPWAETGMAESVGRARMTQWAAQGLGTLAPDKGLAVFQRFLGEACPQVVAMEMAWPRFFAQFAGNSRPPFFELIPQQEERPTEQVDDRVEQIKAAQGDRQRDLLREYLRALVARVLGLDSMQAVDMQQGFFQMGLDSLTSMEMRNRLQQEFSCALAATLLFKYPTVETLADHLLNQLFKPAAGGPGSASPAAEEARWDERAGAAAEGIGGKELAELSEEEAEALLLAQLERLNF